MQKMRNVGNPDIEQLIADKRIYLYELAAEIGVSVSTLQVWRRTPFTPERKRAVKTAIRKLSRR